MTYKFIGGPYDGADMPYKGRDNVKLIYGIDSQFQYWGRYIWSGNSYDFVEFGRSVRKR